MLYSYITSKLGGYYRIRQRYEGAKSSLGKRIYRAINKGYQIETGSYLPFNSIIKGPVNFLHGTYGIFISGGTKIGKNCTIFQQVTIGSNMLIDSKGLGSPEIGDNCLIGAGAKIIGNIKIGNNCRIGANAVVSRDLPDNSVIVLSEPKIYHKACLNNNSYQLSPGGWGYSENGNFILETDQSILDRLNELYDSRIEPV